MNKKIRYPGDKGRKYAKPKVPHANRGKAFEKDIIRTNINYLAHRWAQVIKVEPAIQIQQEIPPNKVIGFKKEKGFVDFFGCYNGRAIAFEAKKINSRTSYPLSKIGDHQMEVLRDWKDQGGISFFLIQFEKHHEVYYVTYDQVEKWWLGSKRGERKSIPYEFFKMECKLVKTQRGVPYDYLDCI